MNRIREMEKEIREENALLQIFESEAFAIIEERTKLGISRSKDILYNKGTGIRDNQVKKMNLIRMEIKVMEDFLRMFYDAPENVRRLNEELTQESRRTK